MPIKEHGHTWVKSSRRVKLVTYQCDGEDEMGLMFGWPNEGTHHQVRMSWIRVEIKKARTWDDSDRLQQAVIHGRMTFVTANEHPNIGPGMTCTFGRIEDGEFFDPREKEIEWKVVSVYDGDNSTNFTVNCEARGGFTGTFFE